MNTSIRFACLALLAASCASTPETADHAACRRAVLDYVEAIELAKPELIKRSVHPDLQKHGYSWTESKADYRTIPMTYDRLVEVAGEFVELGYVPENPEHSIELFEVLDKTASAKLTAFWGIDYMHLAKLDGEWKIVHVLWQSPPEEATGGD